MPLIHTSEIRLFSVQLGTVHHTDEKGKLNHNSKTAIPRANQKSVFQMKRACEQRQHVKQLVTQKLFAALRDSTQTVQHCRVSGAAAASAFGPRNIYQKLFTVFRGRARHKICAKCAPFLIPPRTHRLFEKYKRKIASRKVALHNTYSAILYIADG